MLPTLKLLSKIHICLIGILWGADFLCRHTARAPARTAPVVDAHATAKLCDKGNFCVSPHLGGSRLAPQGASPAGLARGLRCFAPQGCRLSLAGPLHLPPFCVKWPPPRQSSPQKKKRPTNLPSAKKSIIQSQNILPHCDSKCPLPTRRAAFHHRDIRRFQPMFR